MTEETPFFSPSQFTTSFATTVTQGLGKKDALRSNVLDYAERLYFEDQTEREYKKYGMSYIIICPDTKYPNQWLCSCVFNKQAPKSPTSFLLGDPAPSEHKRVGIFSSFEQADAWLEKNKYFGLKNTKYYEGIYASWG